MVISLSIRDRRRKKRFGIDREFSFECIMLWDKGEMSSKQWNICLHFSWSNSFIRYQTLDGNSNDARGWDCLGVWRRLWRMLKTEKDSVSEKDREKEREKREEREGTWMCHTGYIRMCVGGKWGLKCQSQKSVCRKVF